ncbi:phosphoenolpyruvate synthase, partial [Solemya velum gill symbiont]
MDDVDRVGGKNASLGEMIQNLSDLDVKVPGGFATTADAYRAFIAHDGLGDRINQRLAELDIEDVAALQVAGAEIREWIAGIPFPQEMEEAIDAAYAALEEEYGTETSWAVRSSATAEDLPEASFAGQQETYLNVRGIEEIKNDIRLVFSSLFNDRAISYRVHQGFAHEDVALSAGIQKMVRSDIGSSGVMFTVDTESGFEDVVFITSSYGLGEMVVQGAVNPDEFYVYKPAQRAGRPAVVRRSLGGKAIKMIYSDQPGEKVTTVPVDPDEQMLFSLDDEHVNQLAGYADAIEKHYGRPMDVEWALDGIDNQLYIVQARPETVQSRVGQVIERFSLMERGDVLAEGRSIGQKIGAGRARILSGLDEMDKVQEGDVL